MRVGNFVTCKHCHEKNPGPGVTAAILTKFVTQAPARMRQSAKRAADMAERLATPAPVLVTTAGSDTPAPPAAPPPAAPTPPPARPKILRTLVYG